MHSGARRVIHSCTAACRATACTLTVYRHGRHHQGHLGPAGFVVADGRKQEVILQEDTPFNTHSCESLLLLCACVCVSYPSERDHVERVLSAVDGVQEVAVGDLRTRKHLQLTAAGRDSSGWTVTNINVTTQQKCFSAKMISHYNKSWFFKQSAQIFYN